MSSVRILSGSLTKGSISYDINEEGTLSGSHVYGAEAYADGANLRSYNQIFRRVMIFPRPNTSDKLLVGGKPIGMKYDDGITPTSPRRQKFSKYSVWGKLYDAYRFPGSTRIDSTTTFLMTVPPGFPGGGFFLTREVVNTETKIYVTPEEATDDQPYGDLVFDVVAELEQDPYHRVQVRYNPILSTISFVDHKIGANNDVGTLFAGQSIFQADTKKKITQVINHEMEQRDIGYPALYDDGLPFKEEIAPENPVELVKTHPQNVYLPLTLVDPGNALSMNGVLEPLGIRSNIDVSGLEIPFTTRGLRGTLGSGEDVYRNSVVISEGYNDGDPKVVPFLDAVEYFGPVELPPVFEPDETQIKKFSDTSHMREIYFEKRAKKGVNVTQDFRTVLISGSFDTSDFESFDYEGTRGIQYFGGGTDSIVYGGLKK